MIKIVDNARTLRKNATEAEKRLWQHLRNRQLSGLKFKRQYPIPPYIVDFFCEEHRLIIEADGGQHTAQYDEERTNFLEGRGYKILRYWNNDILENTDGVLQSLIESLRNTCPSVKKEPTKERISLGKIVAAHGIKGLVKILPFTPEPRLLQTLSPLYTQTQGEQTISFALKNAIGKYWLAAVEGVSDRNAAEDLIGTQIWADAALLPLPEAEKPGQLYAHHLIGLRVMENGLPQGEILNVVNYGAGDLLEIRAPEGTSFLMPFTHEHFGEIDTQTKSIPAHGTQAFKDLAS